METLHLIYSSISSRELASMTLLGLFLLWSMRSISVRKSIIQVIKSLFAPKLIVSILLLYLWIAIACLIIYMLGCWNVMYIKEVILFALLAIPLLMDITHYSSQQEFGQLIVRQIKYAAFISVYANLYTLNYWCEIILQFTMCMVVLMKAEIERQNKQDYTTKQLSGCLYKCDVIYGYFILIFLLYQTCINPITLTLEMLLIGVALPFILTIIATPYLYCFSVYGSYEMWFIRLKRSVNDEKVEYAKRKKLLLKHCWLNLRKLKYFEQRIKLFMIRDYKEFQQIVQLCEFEYRNINN